MGTTTVMTAASDRGTPEPSGTAPGVGRALRGVALVGLGSTAFAWFSEGTRAGLGVAYGAALAVGNFWVFARVIAAFLDKRGRTVPWIIVSLVKVLALFAAAYELMKHDLASPLALAIGYGSLPVGIVVAELFGRTTPRATCATPDSEFGLHGAPERGVSFHTPDAPNSRATHNPIDSSEPKGSGSSHSVT